MVRTPNSEPDVFGALSHPARRQMLEVLAEADYSVNEIAGHFAMSRPAVSQHLAILKDAGLVTDRREGRCIYYRMEPLGLKPVIDWVSHYRAFWPKHIEQLENLLDKMDE
ncbi:ArsR/SmtB family transcription factor [Bremerella alba]|uniref:HTH arsR-type domain-containing protein n=1 Tax=Bremerella alba TaxID=980252 RepID=A0A7V9A8N7_9BACT|nr:metalloregulator ArsR/SmtB family transcription factor [Bremerella alba]MBA2116271.1 hypothetical protein [Bremerella alba]